MLAEVSVKVLVTVLAILSKKKYWWKYWQYFSNEVSVSISTILTKSIVNNPNYIIHCYFYAHDYQYIFNLS